ncbi:DinB family protein [Fluviicola sp.]|uniref:DinB family protein n=1 Tax=Fluviicola sp. TaxID=1917219 RepID=UPI0031E37FBA
MNKQYFKGLMNYTHWANRKVMGWLEQLEEEQWNQVHTSSFSSVRETVLHIASAEKIWIDFWNCSPDAVYLSSEFRGSTNDLLATWKLASEGMEQFVNEFPEERLSDPVTFRYPRGGVGRMLYWQSFAHIVNHSTYHRGQLVTLLRQAGFTELSSVDLATYYLTE